MGSAPKRRYSRRMLRPRHVSPAAPSGIPGGLSDPTGVVNEPGRAIWKFMTLPITLTRGRGLDVGPVVTSARLVTLFWGEFWLSATDPSVDDIYSAIQQIVASPYLSELSQYGFESLTLDPPVLVFKPGPTSPTFNAHKVKDTVWALIDDGRYPEPDEDGGAIVYMVFAPGDSNYENLEAMGAHDDADDWDPPFDTDHAWVGWCDHGSFNQVIRAFTHELVEIITDPQPPGGWTVDGFPEEQSELVDVCLDETGIVNGLQVCAYYSQRLKACVVPSLPQVRSLDIDVKWEGDHSHHLLLIGRTETTRRSMCFSGTYGWALFEIKQRAVFTANPAGFVEPQFEWKVNGTPVHGTATAPDEVVTAVGGTTTDPLSLITVVAGQTVTAKAGATGNVLVLESQPGASANFDVLCTVTEKNLPSGYHATVARQESATLSGTVRVMDERFQTDLAHCMHLKSVLARNLMKQLNVYIEKGDPPPRWEGPDDKLVKEAEFLARAVDGQDPDLSATLREFTAAARVQSLAGQYGLR